ncbi:MAG: hypothetical protein ACRC20_04355 [Segniliparus sp.]|uniref:hypothetical protein n=1 Tax=Segniliparus sp. TaxID=2804064 RepID=UPI003F3C24C2
MTPPQARRKKLAARVAAACAAVVAVGSLAVAAGPQQQLARGAGPAQQALPGQEHGQDQVSEYFFGGKLDDYGLSLDVKMRRKLLVLRAHRRLNPCGVVDPVKLVAADPSFQRFGVDGDLSACSLFFEGGRAEGDGPSEVTVKVSQNPPTMREVARFAVGSVVVRQHAPAEPGTCLYAFDLGVAQLPAAPERLADFQAQITAPEESGDDPCARGHAVAASAAARVSSKGAPQWSPTDPVARVAEADPCLPARKAAGVAGLSDADVGTHWCAFLIRPSAKAEPVLVKLSAQLRPAAFANQQSDSWNLTETQTTERGDTMLVVYSGAFDPATKSYRPSSDKQHCAVYLMAKDPLLPRTVDASEVDESETRLPVVAVEGDQAPCSVNRDVAAAWAAQLR